MVLTKQLLLDLSADSMNYLSFDTFYYYLSEAVKRQKIKFIQELINYTELDTPFDLKQASEDRDYLFSLDTKMYNKFVMLVNEDSKSKNGRTANQPKLFDMLSNIVKQHKKIDRRTLLDEIGKVWWGQPTHAYRFTLIFWNDVKKDKYINIKFYNDELNWVE